MTVSLALVHHPVLNRRGEIVTTAVTNLDIHDLARAARSYGIDRYYLVTPLTEQQALVQRIAAHWRTEGATLNPRRAEAIALLEVVPSLDAAIAAMTAGSAQAPRVVATTARTDQVERAVGWDALRTQIRAGEGPPLLLVFGTGWGLAPAALAACDAILPPIAAIPGRDSYNHLSVRSAVAIVLDRLLGARD